MAAGITPIRTETGAIAPVVFTEPREVSKLLEIFHQTVTADTDPNVLLIKPSSGSSGYTFLCTSVTPETAEKTERVYTEFVLKWVPNREARNEIFCADLIRHSGFRAPKIHTIEDSKLIEKLAKIASKLNSNLEIINQSEHTLLYMPKAPGATLKGVIADSSILKLQDEEKRKIFKAFGKVALFDLAMGNYDRMFRIADKKTDTLELGAPGVNPGNMMLYISTDKKEAKSSLKSVDFIDNTSNNLFAPPKEAKKENIVSIAGLFDVEEEDEWDVGDTAEASSSSAAESPDEIAITPDEAAEEAYKLFCKTVIKLDEFANLIYNGLHNEFKDKLDLYFTSTLENAKEQIRAGLDEAIISMRQLEVSSADFDRDLIEDRFNQRVLTLFQKNVKHVQQQ